MSFDIFLGNFKNGASEPFPRSIVENAFGRYVERNDAGGLALAFPDGGRADMSIETTPMIRGFAVNRPPISSAFWEGIFFVLKSTSSVLFWAGDGCVVASANVVPDLPKDLIEALGMPTIVTQPKQILERIERSN
jgi:hypothetical protein